MSPGPLSICMVSSPSWIPSWKPLKQFSWMWCHNPSWNSCSCRTYLLTRRSCLSGPCAGCQLTDFSVNPAFLYSWHFPRAEEIPPGVASVCSWIWCSLDELWWDCTRAVLDVLLTPSEGIDWLSWKTCKVITFVFCPGLKMCFIEYSDKLCAMWDLHLFPLWSMSDQIEAHNYTTQRSPRGLHCCVLFLL